MNLAIELNRLVEAPVPVWFATLPSDVGYRVPFEGFTLLRQLGLNGSLLRGVSVDRLVYVMASGVDVDPPTEVLWADPCLDTAWKHSGWPKVVLVYDLKRLRRTFVQVAADSPANELEELRASFPTTHTSADGKTLWMSRLPADDGRLATDYEVDYAWWIPADQLAALRAVLLFARPEDGAELKRCLGLALPEASGDTSKAASRGHPKSGQWVHGDVLLPV